MDAPVAPPLNVKSLMKPPEPVEVRIRGSTQGHVSGLLTTFDEETDMYNTRCSRHIEHNVLQACGLRSRPVHTCGSCPRSNVCCVDDEVSHLAVEDIDRDPVEIRGPVRVSINQAKALKAACGF